jgi:hypothetical protein
MSRIEYNPSLNDKVAGQLGDLGVEIQIPLSSIKDLIMPYKVYTALVSQSGGDEPLEINGDEAIPLTIGVTYEIIDNSPNLADFTNVGAPNNNVGTKFVATGTTPASWGNIDEGWAVLGYIAGAPTVTVLENTIGDIWFTYEAPGMYIMNSNGLLPNYKTWGVSDSILDNSFAVLQPVVIDVNGYGPDQLYIRTQGGDFNGDGLLIMTPIEIRVYN